MEYLWRQNFALQLIGGRSMLAGPKKKSRGEEKEAKTREEQIPDLNEYETFIQEKVKDPKVAQILANGIPGLNVLINPTYGFYLLIDFSAFKGKWFGLRQLNTALDFQLALYASSAFILTISAMLYHEKPVLRCSLGTNYRNDILIAFIRMHEVLSQLTPEPLPEVREHFGEPEPKQTIQPVMSPEAKSSTPPVKSEHKEKSTPYPKLAMAKSYKPMKPEKSERVTRLPFVPGGIASYPRSPITGSGGGTKRTPTKLPKLVVEPSIRCSVS